MTTIAANPTDLDVLAHRIRSTWVTAKQGQVQAWQGYFAVGALLATARAEFPGDREYGRWFAEQDFGFSAQWGRKMIEAAAHQEQLEGLLDTAVTSTGEPPGLRAMLAVLEPPSLHEAGERPAPPPLIAQPDHHSSVVVSIAIDYPVGPTLRVAGQGHGSGADRREWHRELVMATPTPKSAMDFDTLVVELVNRLGREMRADPLLTMRRP